MLKLKTKMIPAAICTMMLLVCSMLAGCTLNVQTSDAAEKTNTTSVKKTAAPTGQPTVTPKQQQTRAENKGASQKAETAPTQKPAGDSEANGDNESNEDKKSSGGELADQKVEDDTSDKGTDAANNEDDSDVPQQGFFDAVLYADDDSTVSIHRTEDGGWFDEDDVVYYNVDEASVFNDPVVNGNGEVYYWSPRNHDGEPEVPTQGAFQAMVYGSDGEGIIIKRNEDGNWYDENGVSFGDAEDANISGEPITNENGETYYWTLPE